MRGAARPSAASAADNWCGGARNAPQTNHHHRRRTYCGAASAVSTAFLLGFLATITAKRTMGDNCVGMGGYSWCAALTKCVRPWEETCPDSMEIDAPTPTDAPYMTSVPTPAPYVPIPGEDHHHKKEEPPVGTYDGAIA